MRREFSDLIEKLAKEEDIIFLTGDLGYNAFENLQESLGERFINTGVAEQNMIGMAAGMAKKGNKVFCYSIAPFATYRCLEQIRVDVCIHDLPVFIVGNGGGYGYGIMGATHHAIEDIACLSGLPNMTCYIPSFTEDVEASTREIVELGKPAYLRLGYGKKNPGNIKTFKSVNTIFQSLDPEVTVLALGPVIQNIIDGVEGTDYKERIDLFSAVKIPFHELNASFFESVRKTKNLLVIEEHIARGGLGEYISLILMEQGIKLNKFKSLHALGYPNKRYGSQSYHQSQSGLDAENIQKIVKEWISQTQYH
jgi:transketolase